MKSFTLRGKFLIPSIIIVLAPLALVRWFNLLHFSKMVDLLGVLVLSFVLAFYIENIKREEKVVSAEKDKLQVILSGITNAVIAVDLQRRVILFNRAAENLTGLSTEEATGKNIADIMKLFDKNKELSPEIYCPVKNDAQNKKVVYHGNNLKLKNTKDKEYAINLTSGTILEKSSIQLGCIMTFRDITRELQMEKMKGEFVTITAHELRTPLTGLKWSLDLLASGGSGKMKNDQKQMINKISATTDHMIELVNDLLNVNQIEEGRFGINLKIQQIRPVLEHIKEIVGETIEKKHVMFKMDDLPELPMLNIDKERIEMSLQNIVDNAIKYSKPGGTVELKVAVNQGEVIISIKDAGIGIGETESARIFSKFFRSNRALLHSTSGTGLGLFVAKNIIEQHGGKIWFESKENQGTTFFVSLPVVG